jgi:hypothetical protein
VIAREEASIEFDVESSGPERRCRGCRGTPGEGCFRDVFSMCHRLKGRRSSCGRIEILLACCPPLSPTFLAPLTEPQRPETGPHFILRPSSIPFHQNLLVSGTRNRPSHRSWTLHSLGRRRKTAIQETCLKNPSERQQEPVSSETKTHERGLSNKLSSRLPPPNLPICPCVLALPTTVTFVATRSLHPGLASLPKSNITDVSSTSHIPSINH